MGRFIFTLFSALAQLEREQIAERTSTAMLRHQAKGRRMTRSDRCPYGWRPDPCDPARLAEDADEQTVIARIRKERRHGRGLREIARRLDLAGIACRDGLRGGPESGPAFYGVSSVSIPKAAAQSGQIVCVTRPPAGGPAPGAAATHRSPAHTRWHQAQTDTRGAAASGRRSGGGDSGCSIGRGQELRRAAGGGGLGGGRAPAGGARPAGGGRTV